MFMDEFYSQDNGRIWIDAGQASRFAKGIAGDFNPIHDPDARRFCVPGDLLFALVLARYGLYARMGLRFHSMVGSRIPLLFDEAEGTDGTIAVKDETGKSYLEVSRAGERTTDMNLIEPFIRRYVAFSGLNFPHYLQPLLEAKGVMFNPDRPLVIYDRMEYTLRHVADAGAELVFARSSMNVEGRRAEALLEFELRADGRCVGSGTKKLVLSGLRPYNADAVKSMIARLDQLKAEHAAAISRP